MNLRVYIYICIQRLTLERGEFYILIEFDCFEKFLQTFARSSWSIRRGFTFLRGREPR